MHLLLSLKYLIVIWKKNSIRATKWKVSLNSVNLYSVFDKFWHSGLLAELCQAGIGGTSLSSIPLELFLPHIIPIVSCSKGMALQGLIRGFCENMTLGLLIGRSIYPEVFKI